MSAWGLGGVVWVWALVQERKGWRPGPGIVRQCWVSGRHCRVPGETGDLGVGMEIQCQFHPAGIPVPQVFQECGVPPKAMARAHRALAPIEEVGRLWTPAAGAEEEQPTTAAGNSLPRMVSWGCWVGGWARVWVLGGWVEPHLLSLCTPRCGSSASGWTEPGASGPGCPWRCAGTPAWHWTSRRKRRPAGPEPGGAGESQRGRGGGQVGGLVGGRGPNPGRAGRGGSF